MKKVSFNVAKALKDAGYPQKKLTTKVYLVNCDKEGELVHYTSALYYDCVVVPAYLDAWLWLWKEKNIRIEIEDMMYKIYDATEWVDNYGYHLIDLSKNVFTDPEEAIKNAIEFLVEKNLIK